MGNAHRAFRRYFPWAFDPEQDARVGILRNVPLFKGIPSKHIRKLLGELVEKDYQAGDVVFREGDPGKALFIVIDGTVRIIKGSNPSGQELAVLGKGTAFGELALIGDAPRYASAVTAEPATLLILYKSYFDELLNDNNAVSSRILMNLASGLAGYIRYNQQGEPHRD